MICSVDDCDRPGPLVRGLCSMHYQRLRLNGTLESARDRWADPEFRLLSNRKIVGDCWIWTGLLDKSGYGKITFQRKSMTVHRLAYRTWIGPLDPELTIDHVAPRCQSKACFNPAHLEQVTAGVNALRGSGPLAQNARKTHCKNNHEFTPENTIVGNGGRRCRECHKAKCKRQYRARQARLLTTAS